MEDLTQHFPDTIPFAHSQYHSLIYQPDKVSLNSYDTIVEPDTVFNSASYTIRLAKPALNVKSVDLLRASFPTPVTNIPDQSCTFWYYNFPSGSTLPSTVADLTKTFSFAVSAIMTNGGLYSYRVTSIAGLFPNQYITVRGATYFNYNGTFKIYALINNGDGTWYVKVPALDGGGASSTATLSYTNSQFLYFVRLQPSWTPPELIGTQYAYNRTFIDYPDLITELNKATTTDPISGSTVIGCQFLANDITFSYNATYNKIVMTGNNATSYYLIAGQQDLNVKAQVAFLQSLTTNPEGLLGYAAQGQPYNTNGYSLAQRLGWTWNGASVTSSVDFANQFRPVLTYIQGLGAFTSTRQNIANSYANLVNTACVYVYVDWIGGSSQDSQGSGGLLGAIPLNTGNNAVGFFDKVISNPLTKIPPQIQEIRVLLKDENGNNFCLPLTAQINLEVGFSYL